MGSLQKRTQVLTSIGLGVALITTLLLFSGSVSASTQMSQASQAETDVSAIREQLLSEHSQDESLEIDQRAAATVNLGLHYGPNAIIAVARASRSPHSEMRLAAIQAAEQWQGKAKWDVISPLLDDDSKVVQQEAVRALITLWPQLEGVYLETLVPAIERHLNQLPMDLDGDLERAWFYNIQNEQQKAEALYTDMQNKYDDPRVFIVYAEYLKQSGNELEIRKVLNQVLLNYPDSAALHYSLGLAYLRNNQTNDAIHRLRTAYQLEPTRGSYGYIYATLIRDTDPETAISIYESIYQRRSQPAYLYALCETLLNTGEDANQCLTELETVAPQDVVLKLRDSSSSE